MFTLIHPVKVRGSRPIFHIRDDSTGLYVFTAYKRKEAEDKQKELNTLAKEQRQAA